MLAVCVFPIPSDPLSLRSAGGWEVLRSSKLPTSLNPRPVLAWYRRLVARKFDGSKHRTSPGRPPIAPRGGSAPWSSSPERTPVGDRNENTPAASRFAQPAARWRPAATQPGLGSCTCKYKGRVWISLDRMFSEHRSIKEKGGPSSETREILLHNCYTRDFY